jgi:hypothetical protein
VAARADDSLRIAGARAVALARAAARRIQRRDRPPPLHVGDVEVLLDTAHARQLIEMGETEADARSDRGLLRVVLTLSDERRLVGRVR